MRRLLKLVADLAFLLSAICTIAMFMAVVSWLVYGAIQLLEVVL